MIPSRVAYVVNVFPKLSETFIAGELVELRRRGVELRVLSLRRPTENLRHDIVARAVVTVSNANARCIAATFGVPPDRIHVIPCGVDTERFRPVAGGGAARHQSNAGSSVPLIVNVARHVPVKNLGLLLEACARLRRAKTRFGCVLVGDGPLRGELEQKSKRLGLENCVQFTGALQQTEVLNWWRRASVAALTSDNEGMPVCLMEAAACAVPAVATAVGGVPELVQDGVIGLLTRPGDV